MKSQLITLFFIFIISFLVLGFPIIWTYGCIIYEERKQKKLKNTNKTINKNIENRWLKTLKDMEKISEKN